MRTVVTGGAGFIGSHLATALLQRGDEVVVFDSFETGRRENVPEGVELVEADLRDTEAVQAAVKGAGLVFHQAALPSVPRSIAAPRATHEVNVTGTLNVLEAARDAGVARVVMASSSSVYGANRALPKVETMTPSPVSPYAVSKLAAESYGISFGRVYEIEVVALRYFNVFGPRQDPTSQYSAVIPKFITAILGGESPLVHGDGEQTRDFTYIENVVAGNLLAASHPAAPGHAFNLACGGRYSLNHLVRSINENVGADVAAVHGPSRAGDVRDSQADIGLVASTIGFEPRVSFEDGLAATVEHYAAAD